MNHIIGEPLVAESAMEARRDWAKITLVGVTGAVALIGAAYFHSDNWIGPRPHIEPTSTLPVDGEANVQSPAERLGTVDDSLAP